MSIFCKKYKCCFIGAFGSGKTSFIRSVLGMPNNKIQSTLGIDFFTVTICVQDTNACVSLWDTAGSERFRSLTESYVRDSDIVFIIYDLTDRNAMASVVQGFRHLENCRPQLVAVVGNKTDLIPAVTHDVHDAIEPWARQGWNIVTGTCSARQPNSTKKIFLRCLNQVVEAPGTVSPAKVTLKLIPRKPNPKTCCT
jgi:small GTP-binding protein